MIEVDELRIIAKDAKLEHADRAMLAQAASEMEWLQKTLSETQAALIQSQQRQIATNEQLIEARKAAPKPVDPIWTTVFSGRLILNGWPVIEVPK